MNPKTSTTTHEDNTVADKDTFLEDKSRPKPLRVAFAGTPQFAQSVLQAIHAAGFSLPLVLTQPDRRAGRGMRLQPSPVKAWALAQSLPLLQPQSLRTNNAAHINTSLASNTTRSIKTQDTPPIQTQLKQLFTPNAQGAVEADILVVVAYGLLLPQWLLDLPRLGCINVHASLLPRWRGAAPIQRAIEAGDTETGVCMMQMEAGLDTGAVLSSATCTIHADTTSGALFQTLAAIGADLCVQTLQRLQNDGLWKGQVQNEAQTCYAAKIDKAQARLDWRLPAFELERKVRAFNPFPVAHSAIQDETVRIWSAQAVAQTTAAQPGEVLGLEVDGLHVAAGGGSVLALQALQRSGGKRLQAKDFLAGKPIVKGLRFVL